MIFFENVFPYNGYYVNEPPLFVENTTTVCDPGPVNSVHIEAVNNNDDDVNNMNIEDSVNDNVDGHNLRRSLERLHHPFGI